MFAIKPGLMMPIFALAVANMMPLAHAQEPQDQNGRGITGQFTLGAGMAPEFEGSDDYKAVPLVLGRVAYETYYLEIQGSSARINLSPLPNIAFGPAVASRGGRDHSVDNDRIARMHEIDRAFEAGGFVRFSLRQVLDPTDELAFETEILADTSGVYDGYVVTFGPIYSFSPTDNLRLGMRLFATYADDNFAQTYFGVNADDAARSGLAQYSASGGLKDAGLGVNALYRFNDSWGLTATVRYARLLGDAADSPIVKDAGSPSQTFIGAGVFYRF
ncbi:MipA/OmpV family protein [Martelella alba]|nr:MipA/OmpV family protein [Martelella alba]